MQVRVLPGAPIDQRRPSSNAESASVLTMKMRVEVLRTAPVLLSTRVKLKRIERRRPKPKAMGSSPITRSSFAPRAGLVQRKNACLTSKLRGFDSCTRHQFDLYPGIAQMAERAIDNREAMGSIPTPWTTLERVSPSGKAPGFQPGSTWVRFPPPAPFQRSAAGVQSFRSERKDNSFVLQLLETRGDELEQLCGASNVISIFLERL
jgi:hypothetical protein